MKDYNEFNGKDFEELMRSNGFVTEQGAVDRQGAADFLGVCKRTIGYMLSGRISKQMYNMLALHAGHHLPGLFSSIAVPRELSDEEFEALMDAADVDLPEDYIHSEKADRVAMQAIALISEEDIK